MAQVDMKHHEDRRADPAESLLNCFSERVRRALRAANLTTREDLEGKFDRFFIKEVPGIGPAGLEEIRDVIPGPREAAKPELVPQPHGGALYRGGVRGNRGGCGATPSQVRAAACEGFADLVPTLLRIGHGTTHITLIGVCPECGHEEEGRTVEDVVEEIQEKFVSPREQVRAAEVLGRYGIGSAKGVHREDLVEHIKIMGMAVQDVLLDRYGEEEAESVCEVIFSKWRKAARERLT